MARKGLDDRLDRLRIHRMARKAAVEIDDMQMLGAGAGKEQGLGGGIIAIDGGAIHVAFGEADHLPSLEVDGGEDDQGHHNIRSIG